MGYCHDVLPRIVQKEGQAVRGANAEHGVGNVRYQGVVFANSLGDLILVHCLEFLDVFARYGKDVARVPLVRIEDAV